MNNINEMIDSYGEQKKIFDPMKKSMENQSNTIKAIMQENNTNCIETENFKATVTERITEGFDENKLISVISSIDPDSKLDILKVKQYVDMDALEDAIYRGAITDENLLKIGECKTTKTSYALTVKPVKKGNN